MDGKLRRPQAIRLELLGVRIELFPRSPDVIPSHGLERPSSVVLRLDEQRLISAFAICIGQELPVGFEREVSAEVAVWVSTSGQGRERAAGSSFPYKQKLQSMVYRRKD